ncbi:hypothetical protein MMC15_006830, partial [Xylographa vitiligo]|nr:hypothetical protein [Xylographa vitiligo]
MSASLVSSFLGALQASLSVLLTIGYGVVAAQFDLLSNASTKEINKLCVRMFLPALLISNVGSQLSLDTASTYVPVLIWSLLYTLSSMLLGYAATRLFNFPSWITPAICFNNTTSLPLLLVQSLESTGILQSLLKSDSDTTSEAVNRAKSYFLVCAIVGNSLTFALGPKLLDGEESPDEPKDKQGQLEANQNPGGNGYVEHGHGQNSDGAQAAVNDNRSVNEETSLLPDWVVREGGAVSREGYDEGRKYWLRLPHWARAFLDFMYAFLNAPLIGAVVGAVVGLVPPLHKAFFNDQSEGGFFKAWLTTSIENIGGLFATLQAVVVGVKLSSSLRKMKRGEDSGEVPWKAMMFIIIVRYLIWPAVSISVIFLVASRTNWLSDDPILWFALMLMPTGPPAMKLLALADVNDTPEKEKLSIAKLLTIVYA